MTTNYTKFLNIPEPSDDLIGAWMEDSIGFPAREVIVSIARKAAAWGYMQCEGEYERAAMQIVPPTWLEPEDDDEN